MRDARWLQAAPGRRAADDGGCAGRDSAGCAWTARAWGVRQPRFVEIETVQFGRRRWWRTRTPRAPRGSRSPGPGRRPIRGTAGAKSCTRGSAGSDGRPPPGEALRRCGGVSRTRDFPGRARLAPFAGETFIRRGRRTGPPIGRLNPGSEAGSARGPAPTRPCAPSSSSTGRSGATEIRRRGCGPKFRPANYLSRRPRTNQLEAGRVGRLAGGELACVSPPLLLCDHRPLGAA